MHQDPEKDELKRQVEAQRGHIQQLAAMAEQKGALDAATRRKLLELARVVLAPAASLDAKSIAATTLAVLVDRHLVDPAPVGVPVVSVEEEKEAC